MAKIKVLIVDDSAIVRNVLSEKLAESPDIEVVGVASDPFIARNKIIDLKPDVITLDIEMPRMDGLTFLTKLMSYYPMPVIIVSSVTTHDSTAAIKALEVGAFDVVNKPGSSISVKDVIDEIIYKIKMAYSVKDTYLTRREIIQKGLLSGVIKKQSTDKVTLGGFVTTDKIVAIGSSTGGTIALEYILQNLPANLPPILIVQHMPPGFTSQFAGRLCELSQLRVKESEDGEIVTNGTVYIAKGGFHMVTERRGNNLFIRHASTERVHLQKPAVDELFNSLVKTVGQNALAILLTGMGRDGAEGLLNLKRAGSHTIAQDESSSIVWGMPKAAIDLGAAVEICGLKGIPERIITLAKVGL